MGVAFHIDKYARASNKHQSFFTHFIDIDSDITLIGYGLIQIKMLVREGFFQRFSRKFFFNDGIVTLISVIAPMEEGGYHPPLRGEGG